MEGGLLARSPLERTRSEAFEYVYNATQPIRMK